MHYFHFTQSQATTLCHVHFYWKYWSGHGLTGLSASYAPALFALSILLCPSTTVAPLRTEIKLRLSLCNLIFLTSHKSDMHYFTTASNYLKLFSQRSQPSILFSKSKFSPSSSLTKCISWTCPQYRNHILTLGLA